MKEIHPGLVLALRKHTDFGDNIGDEEMLKQSKGTLTRSYIEVNLSLRDLWVNLCCILRLDVAVEWVSELLDTVGGVKPMPSHLDPYHSPGSGDTDEYIREWAKDHNKSGDREFWVPLVQDHPRDPDIAVVYMNHPEQLVIRKRSTIVFTDRKEVQE